MYFIFEDLIHHYLLLLLLLLLLLFTPWEFFTSALAGGLLLELEQQQVSRTFSIPADLNKAVVWMISTCPLISKTSQSLY